MPDEPNQTPEELGRTYAAALGDTAWHADLPEGELPAPAPTEEAPPPVQRIVEALLFVGGEPLTAKRAGAIIRGLGAEQFIQAIDGLNHDYRRQGRPYS